MSTGWVWAIWTVVMFAFTWIVLVMDLGPNELPIFMAGTLAISAGAALYERSAARA